MKEGTDKQIAIAGFEDKNMLGWTCSCQSQPCLFVAVNYNALETYLFVRNKAMVLVWSSRWVQYSSEKSCSLLATDVSTTWAEVIYFNYRLKVSEFSQLRLRPLYTREIWKCSFICRVRPTVHTKPSRKWSFAKTFLKPGSNLKTTGFRFSVDGKHFDNGAFRKRWRHGNHVIFLPDFSSNKNPNEQRLLHFPIFRELNLGQFSFIHKTHPDPPLGLFLCMSNTLAFISPISRFKLVTVIGEFCILRFWLSSDGKKNKNLLLIPQSRCD